jgi:hypothetical protein
MKMVMLMLEGIIQVPVPPCPSPFSIASWNQLLRITAIIINSLKIAAALCFYTLFRLVYASRVRDDVFFLLYEVKELLIEL